MFTKNSASKDNAQATLKSFVAKNPTGEYTFDSERDSPESELCRQGGNGEDCVKLLMDAKRLFTEMQSLGFFCALPNDPELTHMECKPLPGSSM